MIVKVSFIAYIDIPIISIHFWATKQQSLKSINVETVYKGTRVTDTWWIHSILIKLIFMLCIKLYFLSKREWCFHFLVFLFLKFGTKKKHFYKYVFSSPSVLIYIRKFPTTQSSKIFQTIDPWVIPLTSEVIL